MPEKTAHKPWKKVLAILIFVAVIAIVIICISVFKTSGESENASEIIPSPTPSPTPTLQDIALSNVNFTYNGSLLSTDPASCIYGAKITGMLQNIGNATVSSVELAIDWHVLNVSNPAETGIYTQKAVFSNIGKEQMLFFIIDYDGTRCGFYNDDSSGVIVQDQFPLITKETQYRIYVSDVK